ncbi:unnamed protein product [Clavelina lepadiformis]|uniref:EamA domain-containing protein n=1 Tax=Clavelina lepadiformis TaxID=159417 RepID=A0ABP0FSZ8_CLALP
MNGYITATMAGFCAALASTTGKLMSQGEITMEFFVNVGEFEQNFCWTLVWTLRLVFLLMTIVLNGLMWTFFVESMQTLSSSVAMVVNVGTNILMSAAIGWFLFNERVSIIWWIGASLIISGMAIVYSSPENTSLKEDDKKD